jgi:hypothetical protein
MTLRKMLNRNKILCYLLAVLLVIPSGISFAESVFLKNGKIIEGKIISESDRDFEIVLDNGKHLSIRRKDVIRTLSRDDYRQKKYLNRMDGTTLGVYIVDEDNESYTYRLELDSPGEVKISKSSVDSISRQKTDNYLIMHPDHKKYYQVPMER